MSGRNPEPGAFCLHGSEGVCGACEGRGELTAATGRDWMLRCVEVSEKLVKTREERDVLASIVRDLAALDEPIYDSMYCLLCEQDPGAHTDTCPWGSASDWVQAQTIAGGASTGGPE